MGTMTTEIQPIRLEDYIKELLPGAHGHQIKAIATFVATIVLVQWKSEFWPAVLSWLSGVVTTSVWEDEAPAAAHRHGNIKTMRPALVKELPYGIPP
jgi:hypothetical protein